MIDRLISKSKPARRLLSRHAPKAGVIAVCLFASVLFFTNYTFAISIEFNNRTVAQVGSQEAFDSAIDTAQTEISDILGYDYDLKHQITTKTSIVRINEATTNTELIVEDICDTVDGIDKQYAILFDGDEIGCVIDSRQVAELMGNQLETYSSDSTISVQYDTEIEFDYKYASVDSTLNSEEVAEALAAVPISVVEETTVQTPYRIMYICSDTLAPGEYEITQEGVKGESVIQDHVVYSDGAEQQRERISEEVLTMPKTLIVSVCPTQPGTSSGTFIWPADGSISSPFGLRSVSVGSSDHKGLDISCPSGTPIYAADGGEVIYSGVMSGYGNLVQIRHENGSITYYAHCSSIDVSVGTLVSQGEKIAAVGMTGTASGYHLHFEVRIDGQPVDPLTLLPQ